MHLNRAPWPDGKESTFRISPMTILDVFLEQYSP